MDSTSEELKAEFGRFREDFNRLRTEIGKVIVGQDDVVEGTLMALVAGGHVLLEGVPGLGKTLLVRTLAETLHSEFARIQFTPDLMPADLIGTNVLMETPDGQRKFEFQKGPVFANVLLADEINRATPKTQSALLEAMQEHSVTVAGQTHALSGLFFVMATQNPLEMEGTYPLPEAQLDRFLFKIMVPFPKGSEIATILDRTTAAESPTVESLFPADRILEMSQLARRVQIANEVREYAIQLVLGTHPEEEVAAPMTKQFVRFGSSPRGAQALILAAKIRAILDGRYHVASDDLRTVAHNALRHRLILNFEGQAEDVSTDQVIDNVIESVREPAAAAV
jgi:MoxR-like ATPase